MERGSGLIRDNPHRRSEGCSMPGGVRGKRRGVRELEEGRWGAVVSTG